LSNLQGALERLLVSTLDDEREAALLLREALKKSARSRVPEAAPELLAFVRGHLMEPLVKRVGAQLAATFIAELQRESDRLWRRALRGRPSTGEVALPKLARPLSTPPPAPTKLVTARMRALQQSGDAAKMRVAISGFDRVAGGVLQRALLEAGCEVYPLDGTNDTWLVTWLVGIRSYTLVLDMSHPTSEPILMRVQRENPPKLVVAKLDARVPADKTKAMMQRLGVRAHRLLDPGVSASGICFVLQSELGK